MNKDTEDKVVQFLRALANEENWENIHGTYDDTQYLVWTKESYDPQYVAQHLLDLIFPDGQGE